MAKFRINCPEAVHKGQKRTLLGIGVENGQIKRIFINCRDEHCRRWFEIRAKGESVQLKRLPKSYHIDFKRSALPTLVVDHGNI